jgi:hypothetical protein
MTSALLHALKLKQQLPLRCPLPHCRARLAMQPALQLLQQQVPAGGALAAKVGPRAEVCVWQRRLRGCWPHHTAAAATVCAAPV